MSVYPIGDQRVGVVTEVPVLDGNGDPVFSEYLEPQFTEAVVWVDRSCFEIQTPTEAQNLTVTTSEIAWAMMPIADGKIPAVDDAGEPAPIPFFDADGQPTINSGLKVRHNGLTYVLRGDAVLEQDIRGRQDHVFCVCEREKG